MTGRGGHNPVVRSFPADQYSILPGGRVEPVAENWEIICPQCGDDGRPRAELPSREYWPLELRKLRGPFGRQAMAIGVAEAHVSETSAHE